MIIEIPGKITFKRTYGSPLIQVPLPLQAHGRTFLQWMLVVIFLCATLFVLTMWLGMGIGLHQGAALPPPGFLTAVTIISFKIVFLMPPSILGIGALLRSGPTLILDSEGLTDRRTGISIPWKSVTSAQTVNFPMDTGIRLTLREPVPPRRFLFDCGGGKILGIRRPDEYILRLVCLNVSHRVLYETVWALVRLNGGTVKT